MILANVLVAVPVMALLTVIQTSILPRFDYFGIVPSLPFLVALAWTMLSNVEQGMVWAFIAGFMMDVFTVAPVGGLSLTYVAAVLAVDLISDLLPRNQIIVPLLSAALATAVQQILYIIYLRLFGITAYATVTSLLELIIYQSILFLPVFGILSLLKRSLRPSPVKI